MAKIFDMTYDEVLELLKTDAEGNRTIDLATLQAKREEGGIEFGQAV